MLHLYETITKLQKHSLDFIIPMHDRTTNVMEMLKYKVTLVDRTALCL